MPELNAAQIILILALGIGTAVAAVFDIRYRKIPNKLVFPLFFAGILYQAIFFGLPGLWSATVGFAIGFGILFIQWIIGGGGGGDVKLMGAISVWLGKTLILYVLVASVLFVILGTVGVLIYSAIVRGIYKTKEQYIASSDTNAKGKRAHATRDIKDRRIMAFAVPVMLATWLVVGWKVPNWPHRNSAEPTQQAAPRAPQESPRG